MDKKSEVDIIGLDDTFKKEHEQAEGDFGERGDDKSRFSNIKKKNLFIVGAVVLVIIIFITFLSSGGIYRSDADFNALIKRVDRIEERLASMEGRTQYHVVARGESLSQIAGKYRLTVDELRKLNNMKARETIHPGQKLLVSAVRGS